MIKKLMLCLTVSMALLSACKETTPKQESGKATQEDTNTTDQELNDETTLVDFNKEVAAYIKAFPYQDTYEYMKRYTKGDPKMLNKWVLGKEPFLVKAGEDKVVRMNNDTYYKMAFMDLSQGPVTLNSADPSSDRFFSFQFMDDHNANFNNVIHPDGAYIVYYGERPKNIEGYIIEAPSRYAVVIVRVEVKNKNKKKDLKAAQAVFEGITITGPEINTFPKLDLLSKFPKKVEEKAIQLLDSTFKNTPFRRTVASPDQIPRTVPYLQFAAGTKGGWGGPITTHSSYETIFYDSENNTLDGAKGSYSLTTAEPNVEAFWSLTVYDTKRGGFLHPNKDNRYHLNNTTVKKNKDGTITFLFKTKCENADKNCIEIPEGPFDYVARYYLPGEDIRSGDWEMPKAQLLK